MGRFLERLKSDDPVYRLVATDDGVLLVRRDGQERTFSDLARTLLDEAGDEFVVFPTPDGASGYERVYLIPLS